MLEGHTQSVEVETLLVSVVVGTLLDIVVVVVGQIGQTHWLVVASLLASLLQVDIIVVVVEGSGQGVDVVVLGQTQSVVVVFSVVALLVVVLVIVLESVDVDVDVVVVSKFS